MTPDDRRYLKGFAIAVIVYLAVVFVANARLSDLRTQPFNFAAMSDKERVVTAGLTRAQLGELKLSYATVAKDTDVALFGNHVAQFFGRDAFVENGRDDLKFFNYWYANLSAVDLLDLFTWMDQRGLTLPKLSIVQLTTPNNDNGNFLVNRSKDLPADIAYTSEGSRTLTVSEEISSTYSAVRGRLGSATSYATLITGLTTGGNNLHVIDAAQCDESQQQKGFLSRLPFTLRLGLNSMGVKVGFCDPGIWSAALRSDGSYDASGLDWAPRRDAAPLDPTRTALHPADIEPLRDVLQKLDALAKRQGARIVFLIPPVYESERYSIVNEVFEKALGQTKDLTVMDHRPWRTKPADYFVSYDHPSPHYWRGVVEELARRELLPAATAQRPAS